jgi:hypothetical protein
LQFWANGSECARIISTGYFKASNNGTYDDATAQLHEFYQSRDDSTCLRVNARNASFAQAGFGVLGISATRSANAYNFAGFYSSGDSDREFQFRGDGNAYADGTFNNNGADYAEYFESANGH